MMKEIKIIIRRLRLSLEDLPTLMEALPDNEVDHEPGEPEAANQLPLDAAQTLLEPPVSHQNPVTVETTLWTDSINSLDVNTHVQYSSTGVVIVSFSYVVMDASEDPLKSLQDSVFHQLSKNNL